MGKCIICERYAGSNYLFCKDCYRQEVDIYNEYFDKYDNDIAFKNKYFKIREKCQNSNMLEEKFNNCLITMYSIAELCQIKHCKNYLIDRVKNDIVNIRIAKNIQEIKNDNILSVKKDNETDKKQTNTNDKQSQSYHSAFDDRDYREQWPRNIQCEDGHYVRSKGEKIIDDWLYHHNIVHAYEKSVYMKSSPNDVVLSDFYIPKGDVYIEFWGMTDKPDYEARKKYKISLYDKNNYKRIDLEDSHVNRIDDIMPRVLGKYDIN